MGGLRARPRLGHSVFGAGVSGPRRSLARAPAVGGHIVIHTHHHMFQTLTRALPVAQNVELFDWLTALFPVWQRLTPEMIKLC
jgi:cytosine/adenosine deaminase-related metal-dependent hydrolase